MEAYYIATLNPSETSATSETYNIWRHRNPEKGIYLDANKLANSRRDIIKNKRLTAVELDSIKASAPQANTPPLGERTTADEENDTNPEITTETTTSGYPGQNTQETPLEEDVLTMKDDILRRWEEVKEQQLAERYQLPKRNMPGFMTQSTLPTKPSMISK